MIGSDKHIVLVPEYHQVFYLYSDHRVFLNGLRRSNARYYLSIKPNTVRIILDNKLYVFIKITDNPFNVKSLFIFRKVKDQAIQYVKRKEIVVPPKYPVNYVNKDFHGKDLISTDINNAYWTIAHNKGVIDKDTFDRGIDYKATSLASLAVLGRETKFILYQGEKDVENALLPGNKAMQDLYTSIRYECYGYMNEVKETLAGDFYQWHTDEVTYRKTPRNVRLVHDILRAKNITYKDKTPVL